MISHPESVMLPPRNSAAWDEIRDKLLEVPKPACDHPNNWLGYFDDLNDEIRTILAPRTLFCPKVGSIWLHKKGDLYRVLAISNMPDEDRYPRTVVYQNVNTDAVWSRPARDWLRSFTLHEEVRRD